MVTSEWDGGSCVVCWLVHQSKLLEFQAEQALGTIVIPGILMILVVSALLPGSSLNASALPASECDKTKVSPLYSAPEV